jgi:glutamate racemase
VRATHNFENASFALDLTPHPIGVIDSGIGGLTVWRELVQVLPHEAFIYFGDSGFCPYGSKPADRITRRVKTIVDFLIERRCKLIVVACNAITASSIAFLREHYAPPFVGMEPAIKPALEQTRTRAIGVLATEQTLKGKLFNRTKATYGKGITIIEQVGYGLVESVEALDFDSAATSKLLRSYLDPMMAHHIDILVLGCTHYPFLEAGIRRILGDAIAIFNPAPAVARHAARLLEKQQLNCQNRQDPGQSIFYTTGSKALLEQVLKMLSNHDHKVCAIEA